MRFVNLDGHCELALVVKLATNVWVCGGNLPFGVSLLVIKALDIFHVGEESTVREHRDPLSGVGPQERRHGFDETSCCLALVGRPPGPILEHELQDHRPKIPRLFTPEMLQVLLVDLQIIAAVRLRIVAIPLVRMICKRFLSTAASMVRERVRGPPGADAPGDRM